MQGARKQQELEGLHGVAVLDLHCVCLQCKCYSADGRNGKLAVCRDGGLHAAHIRNDAARLELCQSVRFLKNRSCRM